MENDHVYIAIDLKSYYASCECADRKFDPLTTNLVVADMSRTEKTICLAVSPSLKAQGIPGRPRLFEVIQKVKEINAKRLREYRRSIGDWKAEFKDKSFDAEVLASDPSMELDYFVAPPRMARYMEVSSKIYGIYLKYVAKEDIVVYSIDEVFIDVTKYLSTYKMTAKELAMTMIRDVLHETRITATAGIGTNLYLAKVAMDIVAKHVDADENGVRVAEIDEISYRHILWNHKPLTDFWRVGPGIARKLEENGMFTIGGLAHSAARPFKTETLMRMLSALEAAGESAEYAHDLMERALMIQLLVELGRGLGTENYRYAPAENSGEKTADILEYIHEHLTEDISIDRLAEQFYLSKYYMMRLFRERTGFTIHAYLTDKRLRLARELIAQGMTASEACYRCGYHDYSAFSRAYKKRFAASPRQQQKGAGR